MFFNTYVQQWELRSFNVRSVWRRIKGRWMEVGSSARGGGRRGNGTGNTILMYNCGAGCLLWSRGD